MMIDLVHPMIGSIRALIYLHSAQDVDMNPKLFHTKVIIVLLVVFCLL